MHVKIQLFGEFHIAVFHFSYFSKKKGNFFSKSGFTGLVQNTEFALKVLISPIIIINFFQLNKQSNKQIIIFISKNGVLLFIRKNAVEKYCLLIKE